MNYYVLQDKNGPDQGPMNRKPNPLKFSEKATWPGSLNANGSKWT